MEKELQEFARAGSQVVDAFANGHLTREHQAALGAALLAGAELAISLSITESGGGKVRLEIVKGDKRASVVEANATIASKH